MTTVSAKPFNPLRLLNEPARIVISPDLNMDQPLSQTSYDGSSTAIVINEKRARSIAEDSWLGEAVDAGSTYTMGKMRSIKQLRRFNYLVHQVQVGAVLREIAGLRYGSSSRAPRVPYNVINKVIDDTLEHNRVEYHLSYDFPIVVPYLKTLMGAVKPTVSVPTRDLSRLRQLCRDGKEAQALEQAIMALPGLLADLDTVWWLVRFGIAVEDADPDLVNFSLPLALTARRGSRQDAVLATEMIYSYIMSRYLQDAESRGGDGDDQEQDAGQGSGGKPTRDQIEGAISKILSTLQSNESPIDAQTLEKALGKGQEVSQSGVRDLAEQIQGDSEQGKPPGTEFVPVDLTHQDFTFFRQTVERHRDLILQLREAFRLRFEHFAIQRTKEGELNLKTHVLQQAYMDSITQEENRTHMRRSRANTKLDVVVLRDISGSTHSMMVPYAEATTCLLTALEGLPGVKTGWVDFNGGAQTIMRPDERIYEVPITPIANGGTQVIPAFDEMDKLKLDGDKRLVFVVTDGEVGDRHNVRSRQRQYEKSGYHFVWINVTPHDQGNVNYQSDLIHCGINQLPMVTAHHVLKFAEEGQ
jgi:hypothetical protein